MKIEGPGAELAHARVRHDHRRHEGDQPLAGQYVRIHVCELARPLDRQHGERRVVAEQRGRQNRSFDRAGKEDDGIEHEFFVRLSAAYTVLRITLELRNHLSVSAPALQKRTCCVVLRLRDRKYLETKKWPRCRYSEAEDS